MDTVCDYLANTGDGMIAMDAEQRILYWNEAAVDMLGYEAAEVVGKRCFHLFTGKTSEGLPFCCQKCAVSRQAARQEPVDSCKVILRHKDGRHLLIDISTITLPPGEQAALVHLFRLVGDAPAHVTRLRIHLLGQVRVQRADGSYVAGKLWRQSKVRALLAYLAGHNGSPVQREELMEMLWPNKSEAVARHNLYTAVHNLRRCLEPQLDRATDSLYILQEDYSYRLNGGSAHWIDVRIFESDLRHARHETNPRKALSAYKSALEIYQGDYLVQLNHTISWHWPELERLRELYLSAMEEYGSLLLQLRKDDAALHTFETILSRDPCRESAARLLMDLHCRRGNRAAALSVFLRLEQVLQEDLHLEPDHKTRTLYNRIANGT